MVKNDQMLDLSENQVKAINLMADGISNLNVSKEIGVSTRTIARWKTDKSFMAVLKETKDERIRALEEKLTSAAEDSILVLSHIMNDEDSPPRVRVSAATAILNKAIKSNAGPVVLNQNSVVNDSSSTVEFRTEEEREEFNKQMADWKALEADPVDDSDK